MVHTSPITWPGSLNASLLKNSYQSADPFPHIVIDDVFDPEFLRAISREFPDLNDSDLHYDNPNERKSASKGEGRMGPHAKSLIHFLNSGPMLEFLQELTGIREKLLPDPYLEGGGYHQIYPGGYLKIHVDFHKHRALQLDRRLNVLVYLNEGWQESYGGHFELWTRDKSKCAARILPVFNRMVIFSTTDYSWHGHPDPLTCPENRSRKSLALYYFTNGRPSNEIRPGNESRITTQFADRGKLDPWSMRLFNRTVNFLNDIIPPFGMRLIKKFRAR